MVNRVFIDQDGFLHIWVIGEQTGETVREMGEKLHYYIAALRAERRPVLIFDNLRRLGPTTTEARREVARLTRELDYDRACMVGNGSLVMRHGTNLMLRAIGRSNTRYFGNEASARQWLRTGSLQRSAGS